MVMYKLVIFDLDGTLLNTLGDLAAAGNHALAELGYPVHDVDAYRYFVGNGIPNLIHRILPEGHTDEEHARCYEVFTEYYSVHKTDLTVPYDGVRELLRRLRDKGVSCAVNTNKAHEFSCELIKAAFGDTICDIIGFGVGFPAKPAPDAALELCRRHSAENGRVLYVGDSNVDMHTAAAAGIDSCAVLWGFRDREELQECSPTYMVSSAAELFDVIVN